MKRLISLLLCFMMVFSMMPTVIAVPVMDSVESAEVEPADVPEETEAEQEVALAEDTTALYATKPAAYDAEKGILVFFDNGNAEDAVNLTNATLVGIASTDVTDGYATFDMLKDEAFAGHPDHQVLGLYTGDPDVATPTYTGIGYNDKAMKGKFTPVAEVYNLASTDKKLNDGTITETQAGNVGNVYNYYNALALPATSWATVSKTFDISDTLSYVGFTRPQSHAISYRIRSFYAYFMPTNNVKLYVNDTLSEIVDLGEATTWTAVVPEGYSLLRDASGNYYKNGDSVAAGAVLTAVKLAERPAQYDVNKGILVFFDNGYNADKYSNINANLVGYNMTSVVDGYVARDIQNPTAAGISGTWGIGLDTGSTDTHFAYADGTDFTGDVWFYADMHNSYTENLGFYWAVRTQWDSWCGVGTNWKSVPAVANAWTKLEIGVHANLSFIGLARTGWGNYTYLNFRSAYAYFNPTNRVYLYEGENLIEIKDLGAATEWTVEAPANTAYNAWKDAEGNVYMPGDKVASLTSLTAYNNVIYYAEKPAAVDATLGNLIYFDNFNAEDAVANDKLAIYGVGNASVFNQYHVKNLYRNTDISMLSPGLIIKPVSGTFEENGYNGTLTVIADVAGPADYGYYQVADMQYTSAYWGWNGWYAGPGKSSTTSFAPITLTMNTAGTNAAAIGLMRGADSGVPYVRSIAIYYKSANSVTLVDGENTSIIDLGTAAEWTVEAPETADFNAWLSSDGRYYVAGNTVPAGTTLTAVTYVTESSTYGTLVWLDDFNFEGRQSTPTYVNPAWDITWKKNYNMSAKSFGTEGDHKYLRIQTYWQGGYILIAENGTGVPGTYTLVVDYKYPTDAELNPEAPADKAWMTFNCDTSGNGGSQYWPAKAPSNEWGTMVKSHTVGAGSTFTSAMFRGGTNGINAYYHIDSMKLYYLPLNYVRLTEGDSTRIVDLGEATEWTVVAPTNTEYNAWIDGEGTYYYAGDKVPAGTALTATVKTFNYAEKPAAVDAELGTLVYFDNFNAEDAVANDKFTFIGLGSLATVNDYYVKNLYKNTDEQMQSPGLVLKSVGGTFEEIGYNGTLTLVVDAYSASELGYYQSTDKKIADAYWGWGIWYAGPGKTTSTSFAPVTLAMNTVGTGTSALGFMRKADNGVPYARSIAVYYKPANSVTLVDGENTSIIDLGTATEWTVTAPTTENCNAWFGSDERYYTAGNTVPAGITLTAATYETESEKYGKLIWSNEFDKTTGAGSENWLSYTYNNPAWNITPSTSNLNFDSFVTLDGRKTVKVNSYWYGGYTLTNSSTDVHGYYTMVVDYYVKSEETEATSEGSFMTLNGSHVYPQAKGFDQWNSMAYTFLATETVPFQSIMFRGNTEGVNIYPYIDSIKLYWHDSNAVSFTEDRETYLVDLGEATELTLPAPKNEAYNIWQDASKNIYLPGTKVAAGTTFTAAAAQFAAKPAQYDATRGILVFFENGNPADSYKNINANFVGYKNALVTDGYYARDIKNPAAAGISGTYGIGLDTGDTATHFAYADGTDFNGDVWFYVDMYNSGTENLKFWNAVRTKWDSWCGVGTNWQGPSAVAGAWTKLEFGQESALSFMGLARNSNSAANLSFRSAYAYHNPKNKVTLYVNGTLSEIVDLGTATEWTVVAPADANLMWIDANGNIYGAGDTVPAGTVLSTMEKAPYSIQKTSIRSTEPNGIRYAGFVTNAMRDMVDEYGFVIARQDIIPNVEDVVFGAENTVHGIAYAKGTNRDIVYVDASESTDEAVAKFGSSAFDVCGYYFTGVLKNIPMESAALQTNLIARTYYRIGDKYYYGDAIIDNVYAVAARIRESYDEVPEYIQQVIDTVEAPAAE